MLVLLLPHGKGVSDGPRGDGVQSPEEGLRFSKRGASPSRSETQRWQALLHVTQCVDGGNKVSGFSSEQSRNLGLELGRGAQTQV